MVLLIACLVFTLTAQAEEWWKLPRTEDETNYYYVGIGEGSDGVEKLQDKAVNKAMGELIREHFGMTVQISESAVEDLKKDSIQIVTRQSSAPLYFKGTSVVKTFEKELAGGILRIYAQIRVNKKHLQEAIDNQLKNGGQALTTYGGIHDTQVDFKVKTNPARSHISLTHMDRPYSVQGQGDALFYLPRGRYKMDISAPGHLNHSEEIIIDEQGFERDIQLTQIFYTLDLEVRPEDARVEIDGKQVDERRFRLASSRPVRFKVSHPDYLDQEVNFLQNDSEDISRRIQLQPRASSLHLDVEPSGSKIEINGQVVKPQGGKVVVGPGDHIIHVSHHGYFSDTIKVSVKPNRHYPIKVIRLVYDDQSISPSDKKLSYRFEYNPFIYQADRGRFAAFPVSFHIEWFYVSLGFGYSGVQEVKEKTNELEERETKDTRIQDTWGAARLISPAMGPVKIFATGVAGSRKISVRDYGMEKDETIQTKKSFSGIGGGVRIYVRPKWSLHAEYLKLDMKEKETALKIKEDRIQVGVAFEF